MRLTRTGPPYTRAMLALPFQESILRPVPALGHMLVFASKLGANPRPALTRLRDAGRLPGTVLGVGVPLVRDLGATIEGLRPFPALAGAGVAVPSTQGALWAYVGGDDATTVYERVQRVTALVADAFRIDEDFATFRYREGRDLSGYLDGTANPEGGGAVQAALAQGLGRGIDGGSFVAVQRYVHDLGILTRMTQDERDHVVGRRQTDNEEIEDAPPDAHVKRAEQEDFDPPAFMVRRSMPWANASENGLCFVAYGANLDAYERVLRRMLGEGDGVVDGLFRFTRPVSGGYYFCPPTAGGALDLSALRI